MTRASRRIQTMIVLIAAMMVTGVPIPSHAEESVRAKVGIQIVSGERVMKAKSRDRLKAGDMLRIYVHPEHSCYVYVIHSDQNTATLLNTVEQRVQGATLVMPSLHQYYEVDGKSPMESFTIICSPRELSELAGMLDQGQTDHATWAALEADLTERSRIDLSQETNDRPFAIAGNVRGAVDSSTAAGDPFSSSMQIFSGRSLLVKQYEFQVR